jgi:hypothetical protein
VYKNTLYKNSPVPSLEGCKKCTYKKCTRKKKTVKENSPQAQAHQEEEPS